MSVGRGITEAKAEIGDIIQDLIDTTSSRITFVGGLAIDAVKSGGPEERRGERALAHVRAGMDVFSDLLQRTGGACHRMKRSPRSVTWKVLFVRRP